MHHSVIALSGILSPSAPQLLFLLSPKRHLESSNAVTQDLKPNTDNKKKLQGIHSESSIKSSSSSSTSFVAETDDSTTIMYQANRTPREMLSLLLARSLQSLCSPSSQCSADFNNDNKLSTSLISPIKCHYYVEDTANSKNALGDDSSATNSKKENLFSYRR